MNKLICLDPDGNYHRECNRNDNRCCMCTKPKVPVAIDEIKGLIKALQTDGINSKKIAVKVLSNLLDET